MSSNSFRFKRFCINHDRCAMKVGTDGVLLGAWGSIDGKNILDIGSGTGLIALIAAQRNPQARVLGIDIDEQAVQQAQENMMASPFAERVSCELQDVKSFSPELCFDAILCNPPFFTEKVLPPDAARCQARNTANLPFEILANSVAKILSEDGCFSVIIPTKEVFTFIALCIGNNLYLQRKCLVRTTARKQPSRAMLTFTNKKNVSPVHEEELCLMNPDGTRSPAYSLLTEDFYL